MSFGIIASSHPRAAGPPPSGGYEYDVEQAVAVRNTSSSATANWASTPTDGNLLIAVGGCRASSGSPTVATPSGWTRAGGIVSGTDMALCDLAVFFRVASSEGSGVTVTASSSIVRTNLIIVELDLPWTGGAVFDAVFGGSGSSSVGSFTTSSTGTLTHADGLCVHVGQMRTNSNNSSLTLDSSVRTPTDITRTQDGDNSNPVNTVVGFSEIDSTAAFTTTVDHNNSTITSGGSVILRRT